MPAKSLIGDKVINPDQEKLGEIRDLMIDLRTGCVAYAVLSFGGIMGLGSKLFAVPMAALTLDEDKECFVMNVFKEKLRQAPGFDEDNWPDMADLEWSRAVHKFYGYTPYWEEKK
jgi:sporulation protein YlmC with PRC-barrel domain